MRHKKIQMFVHKNYPALRNSLLSLLLLVLIVIGAASYFKLIDNAEDIKKIAAQNVQLSKENKLLNQQNKTLAQRNQDYIRCNAELFAKYTQDFIPINIKDLDKCAVTTGNTSGSKASGGSNDVLGLLSAGSSSNPTPSAPASQPNNSQQTPSSPQPQPTQDGITVDLPLLPAVHIPSPF